ncbi:soluble scavenger receptor cysteine-rich domain-containing protein SSC5D-like [Homarus americanus]|uniref:soluble scavenger receptor cysteine-rich domain-containing protein SSC5D-like n=1 Tax=Homarus americanus TaxID=6706 RepID=UPI001C496F7A|nr:soluble scavenger receptor cysteine-rich domain-containing protein SSC5D-like [Homarus americanus]
MPKGHSFTSPTSRVPQQSTQQPSTPTRYPAAEYPDKVPSSRVLTQRSDRIPQHSAQPGAPTPYPAAEYLNTAPTASTLTDTLTKLPQPHCQQPVPLTQHPAAEYPNTVPSSQYPLCAQQSPNNDALTAPMTRYPNTVPTARVPQHSTLLVSAPSTCPTMSAPTQCQQLNTPTQCPTASAEYPITVPSSRVPHHSTQQPSTPSQYPAAEYPNTGLRYLSKYLVSTAYLVSKLKSHSREFIQVVLPLPGGDDLIHFGDAQLFPGVGCDPTGQRLHLTLTDSQDVIAAADSGPPVSEALTSHSTNNWISTAGTHVTE